MMWHAGHQHSKEEVERRKSELQKRRREEEKKRRREEEIKNLNEKVQLSINVPRIRTQPPFLLYSLSTEHHYTLRTLFK